MHILLGRQAIIIDDNMRTAFETKRKKMIGRRCQLEPRDQRDSTSDLHDDTPYLAAKGESLRAALERTSALLTEEKGARKGL